MKKIVFLVLLLTGSLLIKAQVSGVPIPSLPTQIGKPPNAWIPISKGNITYKVDINDIASNKLDTVFTRNDSLIVVKGNQVKGTPLPAGGHLTKLNDSTYLVGEDTLKIKGGGGGTTIISNGGGNILKPQILATGLDTIITLYVAQNIVAGVQCTSPDGNGSGIQYWVQQGDSVKLFYADGFSGNASYSISVISTSLTPPDTTSTGGGDTTTTGGGGGNAVAYADTLTPVACPVEYGSLFTVATNVGAGHNLGINTIRAGYSNNGNSWKKYTDSGYKVYVTYNTAVSVVGNHTALPTDTTAFKTRMGFVLDSIGTTNVLGVHIINEPNNIRHGLGYWTTSAANTINLLRAGANLVHSKGLLAFDGGLTWETTTLYLVYEDFINRGYPDSAAAFAAKAFGNVNVSGWRSDTGHGYRIRYNDTLVAALKTLPLDAVNLHFYATAQGEDSTSALITPDLYKATVRWLRRVSGKHVITNEFGVWNNTNPDIMRQLLTIVQELHNSNGDFQHALWYSGNPLYTLVNSNGSLTDLGIEFKQAVQDKHVDQ
jgi:hypothetical protein